MKEKSQKIKPAGVGDVIENFTNALGIKKCGGCEQRRRELNMSFNWLKATRIIEQTEIELIHYINDKIKTDQDINEAKVDSFFKLYNEITNSKLKKCNCPGLKSVMIERLVILLEKQINKID